MSLIMATKSEYSLVNSSDDGLESVQSSLSKKWRREILRVLSNSVLPWILTAILASLLLLVAMVLNRNKCLHIEGTGTFASSYAFDFGTVLSYRSLSYAKEEKVSARQHVSLEHKKFTGSPAFDEHGQIFIPNPDPVRYVGHPEDFPEIDENWEKLTRGGSNTLSVLVSRLTHHYYFRPVCSHHRERGPGYLGTGGRCILGCPEWRLHRWVSECRSQLTM